MNRQVPQVSRQAATAVDWLVVGGGIHGVHLAARLVGDAEVEPERLRILDPGQRLLESWLACTAVTGMSHLRSSGVHHLDLEPFSLVRFAGPRRHRRRGLLKKPFDRPSLCLFNEHCDQVIERFGLGALQVQDRAERLDPGEDGVTVTTGGGEVFEAGRIILAIGAGGRPSWPEWAPRREPRVRHIFSPSTPWPPEGADKVLVVGGGITGAQVALRLVDEGRSVDLVSRHPPRVHLFDSDPGWLGPKRMHEFRRLENPDDRRQLLRRERHRGSVTPEVHRAVRASVASGRLRVHENGISDLQLRTFGVELKLDGGQVLEGAHLLLATGFDPRRPGGPMLDRLCGTIDFPCAACGYPVVDSYLRWHPRIHVTGPLAELELGPVARNIAGARRAGDRLIAALRRSRSSDRRSKVSESLPRLGPPGASDPQRGLQSPKRDDNTSAAAAGPGGAYFP
ncbi:MAG: FAD/NAD(P)-binding protein [Acidobacteriota bacterium]